MQREYNPDILNDYKTYRREMRKRGFQSHMDFEEFEFAWMKEFDQEARQYASHVNSMTDQRRYV